MELCVEHSTRKIHVPGYKKIYLSAPLARFEYMKIPLHLFPPWIQAQYNLSAHALNDFVYIKMRRAMWELPQAGGLPTDIMNAPIHQVYGGTPQQT